PPPSSFGTPSPASSPDAGAALSYGWKKFQQNVGPLIAVILIPIILQAVLQIIGFVVIKGPVGYIIFGILAAVVSLAGSIGIFNAALLITSGQPLDIGKAFSTDRWGEWIVFAFVF